MVVHILTYATHSEGLFEELVNNKFNIKIKVLGWKQKWKGFTDKFIKSLKYISTLPDDDIIVFLDGFDTIINKNKLKNIENFLLTSDFKVIFSLDNTDLNFFQKYLNEIIFKSCSNKLTANSGLYMGYNKYIQIILKDAINKKCQDDQVNINQLCKQHSFIGIDYDEYLFHNRSKSNQTKSNAMFISYPGTITISRVKRAFKEYTQFFILYVIIINLIILIGINLYKDKFLTKTNLINVFMYIIILSVIDKSCMF